MRFVAFAIVLVIASATANPLNYYERAYKVDWQLVPDANGKMHLVDINSSGTEAEPLFDAFNDVVFRLFTRDNPTTPQAQIIQIYNTQQLVNSNFNAAHPTRFHIHGWNVGGQNTGASIRNAFLNRGDNFNVFIVDWGVGATTPNYILARNRVNDAGEVLAQFINFLNANGLPFSSMGLIAASPFAQGLR